ncbi:unnamed protein product [Peniophora sp. CBMAI 1063]|nr:unnamed protein product [Peniophora sp. CBMAI 1063]
MSSNAVPTLAVATSTSSTGDVLPSRQNLTAVDTSCSYVNLSNHYFAIADGLQSLVCASPDDLRLFREFAAKFKSLTRQPSCLTPIISSVAYHHLANFATLLQLSPNVVFDVWRHHGALAGRVLSWLKGLARVNLFAASPLTSTMSPYDNDILFYLTSSADHTAGLFAPFNSPAGGPSTFFAPSTFPRSDIAAHARTIQLRETGDEGNFNHEDEDEDDSFSDSTLSDFRFPSPELESSIQRDQLMLWSGARLCYDPTTRSYTGKTSQYSVDKNVVSINVSDAHDYPSRRPPPNEGYETLSADNKSHILWRKKIGMLISGSILCQVSDAPRESDAAWSLGAFPSNYILTRRTTVRIVDGAKKKRTDLYLYGATYRFASAAEFAAHAIGLMRGTGSCACKYCSGSPQKDITSILKEAARPTRSAGSSTEHPHLRWRSEV